MTAGNLTAHLVVGWLCLPALATSMDAETLQGWRSWDVAVTAYCPCSKCCGRYADGVTASGVPARGKLIAAPKSIPFGTSIYVPGYGVAPVQDRGAAIRGNRLDLLFPTHAKALRYGRRKMTVWVRTSGRQPWPLAEGQGSGPKGDRLAKARPRSSALARPERQDSRSRRGRRPISRHTTDELAPSPWAEHDRHWWDTVDEMLRGWSVRFPDDQEILAELNRAHSMLIRIGDLRSRRDLLLAELDRYLLWRPPLQTR
jgi:3D (Asp-Asp-Asp) domain-containing protein